MSARTDDEDRVVAAEIVRYLRAHPEAADTVEGAAQWWLERHPQRETIERAMALLVNGRIVERHRLPEGTTVFRSGPRLAAMRPSHDDER
jgi:hypothetical protein